MPPSGSSSGSKSSSSSSSKSSKLKPTELAQEVKKRYIPAIRTKFGSTWKDYSYCYQHPLDMICLPPLQASQPSSFYVIPGDPVDYALRWSGSSNPPTPVAVICNAHDKRAGGDWVTGVMGYEERLCRRSTLSVNLANPGPGSVVDNNYPIGSLGGIFSEQVVVFRGGGQDRPDSLPEDHWRSISVCSVPAVRWPKVRLSSSGGGSLQYSFPYEGDLMRDKIRGALAICAANGVGSVVVGDFGLGNGHRNPPHELARFWAETVQSDPLIAGHIHHVAFVFEDARQSTQRLILDDIAKKGQKNGQQLQPNVASALQTEQPSDYAIFYHYFPQQQ